MAIVRARTTGTSVLKDGTEVVVTEGTAYHDTEPWIQELMKRFPDWFDRGGK